MIGLHMEEIGLLLERLLPGGCPLETEAEASSLGEVLGYIQSHYADELSLALLALRCNLTPSYFSRAFKEKTGTPVFEYINRMRIEKACRLLKRTTMPVIDIALTVGYNNVSFFNRYFRKLNGMSPREYRKHIRT
jgi:YesN/AraC family two-component response regulator